MASTPEIPGFHSFVRLDETSTTVRWRARQQTLDRDVVLKVLKPHLAADPREVSEFTVKAKSAARLRHPNILQLFDVASHGGLHYYVTEFLEGENVAKILLRGPLPPAKAVEIARSVAKALETVWNDAGMIHRNIKPENILVGADGTTKLDGIDLARKAAVPGAAPADAEEGVVEGTPYYLSPEQSRGSPYLDFRADMYGLGASLYQMVTGLVPFGESEPLAALDRQIADFLPHPRSLNPTIPTAVAQLIRRLMMKQPEHRFAAWSEVIRAMDGILARKAVGITMPPNAVSTVQPDPSQVVINALEEATPQRKSRAKSPGLPAWIRVPAWLLLVIWWIFLAYSLLVPIDVLHPGTAPASQPAAAQTPPAAGKGSGATRIKPPVFNALRSAEPTAPDAASEAAPDEAPAESLNVENDAAAQAEATQGGLSADRKSAVLKALFAEDYTQAWDLLREEAGSGQAGQGQKLQDLQQAIRNLPMVEQRLLDYVSTQIGKELTLKDGRREIRMTPRSVAGNQIYAVVKGQAGEKSVRFTLADIPPLVRAQWLGVANTPDACALKFILLSKGGDSAAAAAYAPRSGPLSELFAEIADRPATE